MKKIKEILGLILLTLLFTGIIELAIFSRQFIPILNRLDSSSFEWSIQDIIYSSEGFKKTDKKNKEIVIVNFGQLKRDSIALLIEKIKSYSPKVIGIDAYFFELKDSISDLSLKNAFQNVDLVLPVSLDFEENQNAIRAYKTTNDYFLNSSITFGFPEIYSYDDIRDVYEGDDLLIKRTYSPIAEGKDTLFNCFGYELVRRYNEKVLSQYLNNYSLVDNEEIRFWGDSSLFENFTYKQVLEGNLDRVNFENKIVIVSFLGGSLNQYENLEQKYITPLNEKIIGKSKPDMYEAIIHANIALTVLKGSRINRFGLLTTLMINDIIALILVLVLESIKRKNRNKLQLYGRIIAYSLVVLLLSTSLILYFQLNIKLDLRLAIVYALALPDIYLFYINKLLPWISSLKINRKDETSSI